MTRIFLLAVSLTLPVVALTGCSKSSATSTPAEITAFKGDPSKMPADVRAKVDAAMKNTAAKGQPQMPPVTK